MDSDDAAASNYCVDQYLSQVADESAAADEGRASRFHISMKPADRAIFPQYDRTRQEMLVTEQLLSLAKMRATTIVRERQAVAQAHFTRYAVRAYRVKPQQVTFDRRCIQRIRKAALSFE